MKKMIALLQCLMLVLPVGAAFADSMTTEITLWTFPIGDWGKEEVVNEIIASFNAVHPEIKVKVEYLDYTNGDAQVTTAIEAGTTPDLIMEGPERLVANWGAAGKMLDVNDLWTEEALADIDANNPVVSEACRGADGNYYLYPLCLTAHSMCINKTAFEKADAMQYLDQETRTWTTEGFEKALRALVAAGYSPTGLIFCSGQGGDQGTRALVTNLYDGRFTNEEHTRYTMDSEVNLKALTTLQSWAGEGLITFDPSINGGEEIALFVNGTSQMAFCWNSAQVTNNKDKLAEGVELFHMAFPSEDGVPRLDGGLWGFGLFNNGDDARAAAAREFIRFVCDDATQTPRSVYASGYFSVKKSIDSVKLYEGTDKAVQAEYAVFAPYLGDIYQVTTNWTAQRYEWWNLLQRIGDGGDVAAEVAAYISAVNQ